MTNIQQKMNDWFIDLSGDEHLPDQSRYQWQREGQSDPEESNVRHHASATVSKKIEGNDYYRAWHDGMDKIPGRSDADDCSVYHATWSINPVNTLGADSGGQDAELGNLISKVDDSDGDFFSMVSHHSGHSEVTAVDWLENLGVESIGWDSRYSEYGSFHKKFTVFDIPQNEYALVGSIDINKNRWGRRPHKEGDDERPTGPTHDGGVKVEGDALSDLAWAFVERWNDKSRDNPAGNLENYDKDTPDVIPETEEPDDRTGGGGDQRVQVLTTYGKANNLSWGEDRTEGEWTIWASYLNAIKQAQEYIFIEDQYFAPLGLTLDELWLDDDGLQPYSIFYHLREKIKEGVNVIVLTNRETNVEKFDHQCREGIRRLRAAAYKDGAGEFAAAYLANDNQDIKIHTKLMLCDDVFTLVGSANINGRSMTNDGELTLGILDENDPSFAERLRWDLWGEHSGMFNQMPPAGALGDQITEFVGKIRSGAKQLEEFPEIPDRDELSTPASHLKESAWNYYGELYDGPEKPKLRGEGE